MCVIYFLRIIFHCVAVCHEVGLVGHIMPNMHGPPSLGKRFVLSEGACLLTVSIGTLIHTSLSVSIQTNKQKKIQKP